MAAENKKSRTKSIASRLNRHLKWRGFFRMLLIDIIVAALVLVTWCLTVEMAHGGRIYNVRDRHFDNWIPEDLSIEHWFINPKYVFTVTPPSMDFQIEAPSETVLDQTLDEPSSDEPSSDEPSSDEPSSDETSSEDTPPDTVSDGSSVSLHASVAMKSYVVMQDADAALTAIALGFFLVLGVQIFIFTIGIFTGKRMIKRFLRPIDDIALTAERISAESLRNSERQILNMRQTNDAKMRNLEESINEIGTFDERIDIGDSELGGLEAAVNNMLKRLAESNRKQIQFVDDASHELRTPIAVIQGYANMLDRWGKDDPKVMEESISAIKAESEHMKTLVDQLLFLARGDMDRLIFSAERISLAALTDEIFSESVMIDKEHEYRQILPEEDAEVSVDIAMFKQCIRILIDNARKYTPSGGQITLKSYAKEGKAYIEVTDTGEGISKEDMPHIFDRFYRSATARGKQGSGLGLSIAKWIVEKHQGRIDAISREGTGTRMTVVVSVAQSEGPTGEKA